LVDLGDERTIVVEGACVLEHIDLDILIVEGQDVPNVDILRSLLGATLFCLLAV